MRLYGQPRWQSPWSDSSPEAVHGSLTDHLECRDLHILPIIYPTLGTGDVPTADYVHNTNVVSGLVDTFDISGSWSVTLDVQECVSFTGGGDLLGFPNYGGPSAKDPPLTNNIQLYEQAKIGGALRAQLVSQGQTLNTVIYITAANQAALAPNYQLIINASLRYKNYDGALSVTGFIGATAGGASISGSASYAPLPNGARSTGSANMSGGVSLTGHGAYDGTTGLQQFMVLSGISTIVPPKSWNLTGVLRAMSAPYPAHVDMQIDRASDNLAQPMSASGTFANSGIQESYSVGAGMAASAYGGTGGGVDVIPGTGKNTFAPVRLWIRPGVLGDGYAGSLLALGEDRTDWRVMMRAFRWNALTMTQAAVQAVDSTPVPANWTAGTNTTLAGGMTITRASMTDSTRMSLSSPLTAQAPAGLKGTSFSGVSFAGYAFLRLYLTADAAGLPAKITLGSKTWDVTVGTTGFLDLDLCAPTNGTIGVDAADTKWPYASVGPEVVTDGALWGVTNVTSLGISNLAVAQVYTLTGIELRRKDHSKAWFLAPLSNGVTGVGGGVSSGGWVLREPPVTAGSVTTTTNVRRFLDIDVDGRRAQEIEDYSWVHIESAGAVSDTFGVTPLSSLVGNASYPHNGVTVVDLMPTPSSGCPDADGNTPLNCWLNSSQPLHFAFGGGAYTSGTTWTYGFGQDISGTLTIPAQMLVDSVDWYPDCGDVFNFGGSGAYGTTIQLRAAKLMRGSACGIVVSDKFVRVPRRVVKLKDAALVSRGMGTTARITGEYETGSPFALGSTTNTASQGTTSSTGVYPSRYRRRTCYAVTPTCCQTMFCSDHFYFPFAPQAGDHTRLPLEDWRPIPDVSTDEEEQATTEKTLATAATAGGNH